MSINLYDFDNANSGGDKEAVTVPNVPTLINKLSANEANGIRNKINEIIPVVNGISPIHFLTLKLIAKGEQSSVPNVGEFLEVGDIVQGFKNEALFFDAAKYLGGDETDIENYEIISEVTSNKTSSYTSTSETTYPNSKALSDGLGNKATDSNVLHKTGNETKDGVLTLNETPIINKLVTVTDKNQYYDIIKDGAGTSIIRNQTKYWNGTSFVNSNNGLLLGFQSGYNNTGIAIGLISGYFAGYSNTGSYIGLISGHESGYNNTGTNIGLISGFRSGYNNTGIAIGLISGGYAGYNNKGSYIGLISGDNAGYSNTGSNVGLISGQAAGYYNEGSNNIIGHNSHSVFADNVAGAKTSTSVDISTDRITITAHGFGSNGSYTNLKYTTSGTAIGGLISGNIYQVQIIDANTIYFRINNLTSVGTGTHTFTPQFKYDNVNILGNNVQPTQSNQSIVGNSNTTSTKLFGVVETNDSFVKSGATTTNLLQAGGGDTPIKTVGGVPILGSGNITEVQNSLAASTTLAPSVTAVNNGISAIKIGGRNFVRNFGQTEGYIDYTNGHLVPSATSRYVSGFTQVFEGEEMTISRSNLALNKTMEAAFYSSASESSFISYKGSVTLNPFKTSENESFIVPTGAKFIRTVISFSQYPWKLERGNKSTDWSPNPDDFLIKEYTVATLPTGTSITNVYATVTDATSPSYLSTVVGGGAVKCPVFWNGTNWVCH